MYTVGLDISALDETFKSHAFRGIGRYVAELKKYFDSHQPNGIKIGTFDHREFQERGMLNKLIELMPAGRQTIRQQLVYPLHLGRQNKRFQILHFPAHMDAPAWSVGDYILTVLDLIPLVMSDLYKANKAGIRFRFARWLEIKAIKNASLILAISQNTADDVHRILGVPYERIVVTPLGVDKKFFKEATEEEKTALRKRFDVPAGRKLIAYVGGIDPRKNYRSLLESFSRLCDLCKEKGSESPLLMLVGSINNDREYPRLQALIKKLGLEGKTIETGYVPDVDLPATYALSDVLFFPSLYEGFGLTPLESMASGTAVVTSRASCMPEVLGEAAIYADVSNFDECARMLYQVLSNRELERDYIEKGRARAALFSWNRTGELTLSAYEKLLKRT